MIRPSVLVFVTVTLAVLSVSSVPAESPSPPQVETDLEHALTLLDSSMSERGAKWRCHPTPRSFHCSKDGCNEVPDTVWFNLDFASLEQWNDRGVGCRRDQHFVHKKNSHNLGKGNGLGCCTVRLRLSSPPSYNTPPCEAPMPFSIRPYRRLPVLADRAHKYGPAYT